MKLKPLHHFILLAIVGIFSIFYYVIMGLSSPLLISSRLLLSTAGQVIVTIVLMILLFYSLVVIDLFKYKWWARIFIIWSSVFFIIAIYLIYQIDLLISFIRSDEWYIIIAKLVIFPLI